MSDLRGKEICDSTQAANLNVLFYGVPFITPGNMKVVGFDPEHVGFGVKVVGFDLEHVELGVPDGLESMAVIGHLWQWN